jgi:hypothetical protein
VLGIKDDAPRRAALRDADSWRATEAKKAQELLKTIPVLTAGLPMVMCTPRSLMRVAFDELKAFVKSQTTPVAPVVRVSLSSTCLCVCV